jgi:hypothetical protein
VRAHQLVQRTLAVDFAFGHFATIDQIEPNAAISAISAENRVCTFLIGLTGSAGLISAISAENAEFFALAGVAPSLDVH